MLQTTQILLIYCFLAIAAVYDVPKSHTKFFIGKLEKSVLPFGISVSALIASNFGIVRECRAADLREQLANKASSIPGMGQPDIFYPPYFEGTWAISRNISEVITSIPTISLINEFDRICKSRKGFEYNESYIKYGNRVVKDRAISTTNFIRSLVGTPNIISSWDISNPNILKIISTSYQLDIRITKRSTEAIHETEREKKPVVGYSEFAILSESSLPSSLEPPKVYGGRTLVRLRKESDDEILGIERFFIYPFDTVDLPGIKNEPLVTIKSNFIMNRIKI